jgi:hypothetical protein
LIVRNVVVRQSAPFAVFEPLVKHLVTADMEIPNVGRDALKELGSLGISVLTTICRGY